MANLSKIILPNNTTVNLKDANVPHSSLTATSSGTALSLVTTGEKYTWNNKQNALTRPVTGASVWDTADRIVVTNANSGNVVKQSAYTIATSVPANAVFTDTKVTSADNHYAPTTVSGQDKTASASGATAAWSIDVVKGVTLNTDGKGHVTGLSVTSGKIPANPNTDTKVRQTLSTTNKNYPLLLSYGESSDTTANIDNVSYRSNTIYANPSTGNIQATQLNGVTIGSSPKFTDTTYTFANGTNGFTVTPSGGTAQTITVTPSITNNVTGSGTSGYIAKFNGANTITNAVALGSDTTKYLRNDGTWQVPTGTTYSQGTGISISGTTINHSNSVTAGTVGTSSATSGSTLAVPYVTYDAQGHVTASGTHTHTVTGFATTDTKNTAGATDTSSKIFLIGATSQATNPQTYSDDQVYVTNGTLTAGNAQATILGVVPTNGTSGGISLYGGTGQVDNYGIAFRTTANKEKHGYVQSAWATYFTMNDGDNRGWIFRRNKSGGNVASINTSGNAVFNGSVTVGGNTTNTTGCSMEFNSTTQSLDFVFK